MYLGRRLRVWQKVPPERHAFLVGDNQFTDAWVLHGRAFASEAKIPRSDPRRGYCPVDSASVIIKRGVVPQIARDEASPTETPRPALRFPEGNSILDSREQNRTTSLDNLPRINQRRKVETYSLLALLGGFVSCDIVVCLPKNPIGRRGAKCRLSSSFFELRFLEHHHTAKSV